MVISGQYRNFIDEIVLVRLERDAAKENKSSAAKTSRWKTSGAFCLQFFRDLVSTGPVLRYSVRRAIWLRGKYCRTLARIITFVKLILFKNLSHYYYQWDILHRPLLLGRRLFSRGRVHHPFRSVLEVRPEKKVMRIFPRATASSVKSYH